MSSLTKPLDAVFAGQQTYTIRQASEKLGIDQKTLLRRMERIGEKPGRDTRDQRRSVVTEAQVARLCEVFEIQDQNTSVSPASDDVQSSRDSDKVILERITLMEDSIEASIEALRKQVAELNSAFSSVSLSLATTTKTVARLTEHVIEDDEREQADKRKPRL